MANEPDVPSAVEFLVHARHAVVQTDAIQRIDLRRRQVLEQDAVAESVGRLPLRQVGNGADFTLALHDFAGPTNDEPEHIARTEPLVSDERHARVVEVNRDAVTR